MKNKSILSRAGIVQDAHPVGIDGKQQLMLLGVIVIAHGDGIHRKFVGVGGIVLAEPSDTAHAGKHFRNVLIDLIQTGINLELHFVGAGKILLVLRPDTGLCAGADL